MAIKEGNESGESSKLKDLFASNGYSIEKGAELLGVPFSTLYKQLKSDKLIKKNNYIDRFAAIVQKERGYNPLKRGTLANEPIESSKDKIFIVPQRARAGFIHDAVDVDRYQAWPYVIIPWLKGKRCFGFEIDGDSMEGVVSSGDIIIGSQVESASDVKNGRLYIVETKAGLQFKIVNKRAAGLELVSTNPNNKPEIVPYENVVSLWHREMIIDTTFKKIEA